MGGAYPVYCETPIPKAKRIRIGKLNNPAKRRVQYPAACYEMFPKLALGFIPVIFTPMVPSRDWHKNGTSLYSPCKKAISYHIRQNDLRTYIAGKICEIFL